MEALIKKALDARKQAYAPYSHFSVGAALQTSDGMIFTGCNIENAAYPITNCAERTALFKAVSEGYRSFHSLCVVGGPSNTDILEECPPCGLCRQALREFCDPDSFNIVLACSPNQFRIFTLSELLPNSFGPVHLKR